MEIKDWLYIAGLVVTLAIGVIGALPVFRKTKIDINSINAETIKKLSDEIDDYTDYRITTNARFTTMELELEGVKRELRNYKNAFARAVKFIHDTNPGLEMPDFFETKK